MKEKLTRKFSAGGVVFKRENGEIKILLLKRDDPKERWLLPKGEIEGGVKKTALREINEEAGLKNLFLKEKIGEEKYFYKESWAENKLIFKIVTYFLVEAKGKEKPKPQKEEGFVEAKWFNPREAQETITFKNSKDIIQKAMGLLNPQ